MSRESVPIRDAPNGNKCLAGWTPVTLYSRGYAVGDTAKSGSKITIISVAFAHQTRAPEARLDEAITCTARVGSSC